jgi:hypothetical protein
MKIAGRITRQTAWHLACILLVALMCSVSSSWCSSDASIQQSHQLRGFSPHPTGFTENRGQLDRQVRFSARTSFCSVFVTNSSIVYSVPVAEDGGPSKRIALHEVLPLEIGSKLAGKNKLAGSVNYFKGNEPEKWSSGASVYSSLDCGEICPGVNLSLRISNDSCEKIFTVQPRQNPTEIRLALEGADKITLSNTGELLCRIGEEQLSFTKPVAFQLIDGHQTDIPVHYDIRGNTYGFSVGEYDRDHPLIIDPLLASTYLGGLDFEYCLGLEYLGDDGIIVSGYTFSHDFPTVAGCYDETFDGDSDIFVSHLDSGLTTLISSTFVGGSSDEAMGKLDSMRVAPDGYLYFVIGTNSNDFPTTEDAYDRSINGDVDAAVFVLNDTLSSLVASTYLGGSDHDGGHSIAVDDHGDIFISGTTESSISEGFPLTKGAYDTTLDGAYDIFISRFDPGLTTLLASTLLGGSWYEWPHRLICDNDGGLYIAGETFSPDFPTTSGAYDETFNMTGGGPEWFDLFISHLDTDLTTLNRSTFLGGVTDEVLGTIILDDDDTIVIAGKSNSDDFPTTPGAYSEVRSNQADFIVARMTTQLDQLLASTFLGAEGPDICNCAALDDAGYIYVAGWTDSKTIPITPGAHGSVNFKEKDAYIARLDRDLTRLTAATILGGEAYIGFDTTEECLNIKFIEGDKVLVCGMTHSDEFPVTTGAYAEEPVGSFEGFISIFDELLTLHAGKVVVGPGPAGTNPPLVRVYPAAQDAVYGFEFNAYGAPSYGVNVCCGNLDQDEADEIITGAGPGQIYGPHVRGFEIDGAPLPNLSFLAYGTNRWGVNVAAGDIDGDGIDEIITGAGPGEVFGPHVRAFAYDGETGVTPVGGVSYFAYGTPKWGVNVAAGDIDSDGFDEIVTGAGPGAVYGPHVRGWNVDGGDTQAIPQVSFLAYGTNNYGVNVTCGDLDGDGLDEIVTGAGPGAVFGSHVRCWNYDGTKVTSMPGGSFFAWPPDIARYGVHVSSGADMDGDGRDELLTGGGPDPASGTPVKVFTYDGSAVNLWFSLMAFPELGQGVNVAAGTF